MIIQHELSEREATLKLIFPGDLLSSNSEQAETDVQTILEQRPIKQSNWKTLVLDLTAARMIDSVGLNFIVRLIKQAKLREALVKSIITSRTVYRAALATRLDKEMDIEFIKTQSNKAPTFS